MAVDVDTTERQVTGPVSTDWVEIDGDGGDLDSVETEELADDEQEVDTKSIVTGRKSWSATRLVVIVGSVAVVAVSGLIGWLGLRAYQSHQAQQQRNLFVSVGRQGALNLTTINYSQVDADVKRVLDSSTGAFYDDFLKRSQPFIDVVKQAQAKTVGTITEAGLESQRGDQAQVLVAVSVRTSNAGAADQPPRLWRMRITVEKVGRDVKVSNVGFVP
jgi:Mce-associated membrane protein